MRSTSSMGLRRRAGRFLIGGLAMLCAVALEADHGAAEGNGDYPVLYDHYGRVFRDETGLRINYDPRAEPEPEPPEDDDGLDEIVAGTNDLSVYDADTQSVTYTIPEGPRAAVCRPSGALKFRGEGWPHSWGSEASPQATSCRPPGYDPAGGTAPAFVVGARLHRSGNGPDCRFPIGRNGRNGRGWGMPAPKGQARWNPGPAEMLSLRR